MALKMATSEWGGTFYTQGCVFAELFNRGRAESDKCAVITSDASIHNAEQLDRGEIEFGFMASNWIGRAHEGITPFNRKIELRMVAPANAGPMFFVTLANSPIKSVADFKNARIAVGFRGSGMEQHVRTIFGVLGISFDRFTPVFMNFSDGADALIAGEIDAQFQPPIPNRVMTDLSQRADVRVVPYAPGQLEKILAQVPFYRPVTMARGAFRGVIADIPQIAVVNVLVTHKRIAEAIVHDMASAISGNLDKLPEMNALFKGIKDLFEPLKTKGASALEFGGVPLHPGARRAYLEAGWLRS
jgi:TRAP transporter TAXI family solute receptor